MAEGSPKEKFSRRLGRAWWLLREIKDDAKRQELFEVMSELADIYYKTLSWDDKMYAAIPRKEAKCELLSGLRSARQ